MPMNSQLQNQLDSTDILILKELEADARVAFSQIAEKLNVSNSLVHQRVKKLKEIGVLLDPVFRISPAALGYETCAFTQIIVDHPKYMQDLIDALEKIPEITECVNIAGVYAIMVKIYAVNNSHLRDVIYEGIQRLPGVEGTNTIISFETPFRRGVPLEIE
jgi:Lrp/AsnC family transcriptional regulator for asnA, asnC and gidA